MIRDFYNRRKIRIRNHKIRKYNEGFYNFCPKVDVTFKYKNCIFSVTTMMGRR